MLQKMRPGDHKGPEGHSDLRNVHTVKEQSEQRCKILAPIEWQFAIRQISYFKV